MSTRRIAYALLLAALGLAGCTDDGSAGPDGPPVVQPGAPGEAGRTLDPEVVATAGADLPLLAADVAFVHAMIAHHGQALELVALVGDRTGRADITLLAERIELSQSDEIARMEGWLEARGEPAPTGHAHGPAPGMLTPAELAELAGMAGADFDRGFLDAMISHHEGALVMVADLFARGGGQQAEVFQLAADIEADQRLEIDRIRTLRAQLP